MTGVILAAGMAKRLRPLTDAQPKCLLKVGEKTLLERTITALIAAGIERLVVVTGYRAAMIRDFIAETFPQLPTVFIDNPDFANNNNIFSLWLARPEADGKEFILADSDILADPELIKRVAGHPGNAIALNVHSLGDEEMKIVADTAGHVTAITKQCDPAIAAGESVGIEKISAEYSKHLFEELEKMIEGEGLIDIFYEAAFERLIPQGHSFDIVDTTDLFSMELDTPSDFESAQSLLPPSLR